MDKRPNLLLILVCLVVSAVSVFYILKANQKNVSVNTQRPSYAPPVADASQIASNIVEAADGKKQLMVKEVKNKEGVTYTFTVLTVADGSSKEVFRKTVPVGTTLSIPANTFSPDDKYFFLKETSPTGDDYFVPLEDQILDLSALFPEKHPKYKITDVTGWGGMNLIVFNTDKVEGGTGPSFWFEVPSKAFIQLNNRFN